MKNKFTIATLPFLASLSSCGDSNPLEELRFDWPQASPSTPCRLYGVENGKFFPQFPGKINAYYIGLTCTASVPRPDFDRRYVSCFISEVEYYSPGHYACRVEHYLDKVEFTYSFSPESVAAPVCSFTCLRSQQSTFSFDGAIQRWLAH